MKLYNRASGWLSNQTKPHVENSEANEPSSFVVNTLTIIEKHPASQDHR